MISIKRRWVQVPIWVAWFQQDDTRHLSPLWSKTDLHRFYSSPKAHTSVKEVRVSSLSRELLPYPLGISFTPTPLGTSFLEISSLLSAASTSQRFKDKTKSSNKQNSYSLSLIILEPLYYFAPSCNSSSLLCPLRGFSHHQCSCWSFLFLPYGMFRNLTCRSLLLSTYSDTQQGLQSFFHSHRSKPLSLLLFYCLFFFSFLSQKLLISARSLQCAAYGFHGLPDHLSCHLNPGSRKFSLGLWGSGGGGRYLPWISFLILETS